MAREERAERPERNHPIGQATFQVSRKLGEYLAPNANEEDKAYLKGKIVRELTSALEAANKL